MKTTTTTTNIRCINIVLLVSSFKFGVTFKILDHIIHILGSIFTVLNSRTFPNRFQRFGRFRSSPAKTLG